MESSDKLRSVAALTTGERNPMPTEQKAGLTPEPTCELWSEYLLLLPGIEYLPTRSIVTILTAQFWFQLLNWPI